MITVYTAITGGKDEPRTDIKCYSNESVFTFSNSVLQAKYFKLNYWISKENDEVSIYVDGNIYLNFSPEKIVEDLLRDKDIALFKHPHRKNIYEEFNFLKRMPWVNQFGTAHKLREQEQFYREHHLGLKYPLFECGVLIRRNNERVRNLMEIWWNEITNWQERDQVSFPVALELCKEPPSISMLLGDVRNTEYFTYKPHLK